MKITETPRDGLQGLHDFIPTAKKVEYIDQLLKVGFDTVEAGSFVSPDAIPQMRDTAEVLRGLENTGKGGEGSRIMVLAGNKTGGEKAAAFDVVDIVLYPFSVSETFLKRNLNADFDKARASIYDLRELCDKANKELMVYLTMGFGNPYGDAWHPDIVAGWVDFLFRLGLTTIPLSDILGTVTPAIIKQVFGLLVPSFPDVEFGFHLHTRPGEWHEKVEAAYHAGIRRFDTVTGGFGGCPMADDELVSNLDTMDLIKYCEEVGVDHGLNLSELAVAQRISAEIALPAGKSL